MILEALHATDNLYFKFVINRVPFLLFYLLIAIVREVMYFFVIFYFDLPENVDLIAKTCRSIEADT